MINLQLIGLEAQFLVVLLKLFLISFQGVAGCTFTLGEDTGIGVSHHHEVGGGCYVCKCLSRCDFYARGIPVCIKIGHF